MYKAAVIGDADSVCAYAAAGLRLFTADDAAGTVRALKALLADDDIAVIFITEKLFSLIPDEVKKLSDRTVPALIPVPGTSGNTGIGKKNVTDSVIRAVGSDIG